MTESLRYADGCVLVHDPEGNPICVVAGRRRWEAEQAAEPHVNVVTGPDGSTETFDDRTVETLVRMGLIRHDRDDYVLAAGFGADARGYGPLHKFYEAP